MNPLKWLGQAASGATGPSSARIGFLVFVAMGALWLSYDLAVGLVALKSHGIHPDWVLAFGIYAGACTGGYVGGKVAARPPASPAPPPSTR